MSDRWHFRCDTCGTYADGSYEPLDFAAWLHKDREPTHVVKEWKHGQKGKAVELEGNDNE